jgi:hypothetical protein
LSTKKTQLSNFKATLMVERKRELMLKEKTKRKRKEKRVEVVVVVSQNKTSTKKKKVSQNKTIEPQVRQRYQPYRQNHSQIQFTSKHVTSKSLCPTHLSILEKDCSSLPHNCNLEFHRHSLKLIILIIWIMLTSALGTVVKDIKTRNFCIENSVFYISKKSIT